jgi:hypothetical protein
MLVYVILYGQMCYSEQCVKQPSRVRCPVLNEGGGEGVTVQRSTETFRRSRIFFPPLVSISFPNIYIVLFSTVV